MRQFHSNQDFYNFLDELSIRLKSSGFDDIERRIHTLIHKTAWTTSSELLGELRIALSEFKAKHQGVLENILESDIDMCIKTIDGAFAASNKGRKRQPTLVRFLINMLKTRR